MEVAVEIKEHTGVTVRQLRAIQCLNALQFLAAQRQTVTYETLAVMLGTPSSGNALSRVISPILYDVMAFCDRNRLPSLTVLVVRKSGRDTGLPGPGYWKINDPENKLSFEERLDVVEHKTAQCFTMYSSLGA